MMAIARRMKNWKWNHTLFVIIIIFSYTGIQYNVTNPMTSKAKLNSSGNITWDVDLSLGEYGSINMEATTYSSHSHNPKYGIETGDTISFESLMEKSSCQLKITLENLPGLTDLEGTYQLKLDSSIGKFSLQIPGLTMENPDLYVGKVTVYFEATISVEDHMAPSGNIKFIADNYTFHDDEGSEYLDMKVGDVVKGDIVEIDSTYYLIVTDVSIQFKDQGGSIFSIEATEPEITKKSPDTIKTDIEMGKPVPPPPIDFEMVIFWAGIIILAVIGFIALHRRISP